MRLGQVKGPSGIDRQVKGPSGIARQVKGPSGIARQVKGPSGIAGQVKGPSGIARQVTGPSGIANINKIKSQSNSKHDESELQNKINVVTDIGKNCNKRYCLLP